MAYSDAQAHNSSVWTSRTVAACAATLVLAGYSGGGHPADASWSIPAPDLGKTPPKSYGPLLAAVTTWFDLVADGHARQAYRQLVSDRCRRYEALAQFQRDYGGEHLAQGIQIRAYRTHDARHGAVQFISPDTPFTPTAWFWIREHGEWKEDGCPPSG